MLKGEKREEVARRYLNGERSGLIAEMFHISTSLVRKIAKEYEGKIDLSAPIPPPPTVLYPVPAPAQAAPSTIQVPAQAQFREPEPRQAPRAPAPPREETPSTPLFPSKRPNDIQSIKITRVFANPSSAGQGFMGSLDPFCDETVIQRLFGGGRYDIVAVGAQGEPVFRRALDIPGYSKPAASEMLESSDDAPAPIFLGAPPSPSAGAEIAKMMQVQQENTRAQLEAMQRNQDLTIAQLKAGYETQAMMMKAQSEAAVSQSREFYQSLATIMQGQQQKPMTFMEEIQKFQTLKTMMGEGKGEGEEKSALTTAIERLPDILNAAGGFMASRNADDDFEFEDEEDDEVESSGPVKQKAAPGGQTATASAPTPDGKPKIHSIANELCKELIASGVPVDEAKQTVLMGLGFMKQKIEAAQKNKPKPAIMASPAKEPAPSVASPTIGVADAPVATMQEAPPSPSANGSNGHVKMEAEEEPEEDEGLDDGLEDDESEEADETDGDDDPEEAA